MKKKNRKSTKIIIGMLCGVILFGILLAANFYLYIDSGDRKVVLEYRAEYADSTPKAYLRGRVFCKEGFPLNVEKSGTVDTEKLGTYKVTYRTKFLFWEKQEIQTVCVCDTKAPVITLKSSEDYYVLPGDAYVEEGYTAYDECDGDVTDAVTFTEADGIITYHVSDQSGNQATVERKINYNDPIAPEIKLNGSSIITIDAGGTYTEPGYTAIDNCDGDITEHVKVEGKVDTKTAGTYKLTYTVQDSYKNTTVLERTVVVKAAQTPGTVIPGDKVIYLTFDDGPGPYTKDLLAVLDKYNVKATFFVVNGKYNNMIAAEAKAGHSVGIHTATHDYGKIYANKQAFFDDMLKMQDIIYNQIGKRTTLMRFPGGSSNLVSKKYCPGIMTDLTKSVVDSGFQYFDWNVSSGDAGGTTSTAKVVSNVKNGVQGKKASVVLQHDIHKFSVDAVEEIIVWGLNNGYTFKPLDMTSPGAHHGVQN